MDPERSFAAGDGTATSPVRSTARSDRLQKQHDLRLPEPDSKRREPWSTCRNPTLRPARRFRRERHRMKHHRPHERPLRAVPRAYRVFWRSGPSVLRHVTAVHDHRTHRPAGYPRPLWFSPRQFRYVDSRVQLEESLSCIRASNQSRIPPRICCDSMPAFSVAL